jgi:prepilin-type N-terminal cleavage/methylation domain-containing protein
MKISSNKRGMTLVEIIIAFAILAIISVPVMSLFVFTATMNTSSEKTTDYTYLAQSELEYIYSLSQTQTFEEVGNILKNSDGYSETVLITDLSYRYSKVSDFSYVVELNREATDDVFVKVKVIVGNPSGTATDTLMETLIRWAAST